MPPTNPERDPLFRGLIALMAIAVIVMLISAGIGKRNTAGASSPAAVSGGPSGMSGMAEQAASGDSMSAEQMAAMHERSMKAYPAKTQGQGDQVLPPDVVNGVKVFHLMAMPVRWEVAPGQFATALAYNEQVPGPQIRVYQGDTVKVVLTNHLTQPTTIHWHGLTVPNSMDGVPYVTQNPVMPGGTFTYR